MASEGVAFQTSHPFPREVEPLHVSDHIMEEGAWNKPKMERVLWEEDRRIIQSIPIIQTLVPHSWCWQYSRIGSFTTKVLTNSTFLLIWRLSPLLWVCMRFGGNGCGALLFHRRSKFSLTCL